MLICIDDINVSHPYELTVSRLSHFAKYSLITRTVINGLALLSTRVSVAFLALRLCSPKRWFVRCTWVIIVLLVAVHVPLVVAQVVRCKPIQRYWRPDLKGSCWPDRVILDIAYINAGKCIV